MRGSSARPYPAGSAEHESLLSPHHHPAQHHGHLPPPPMLLARRYPHRRDRRALSLELPELLQVPTGGAGHLFAQTQTQQIHPLLPRKKSSSGERAPGEHQDCNGKAPAGPQAPLLGEVFPQLNSRKDKGELEEEADYVSASRVVWVSYNRYII